MPWFERRKLDSLRNIDLSLSLSLLCICSFYSAFALCSREKNVVGDFLTCASEGTPLIRTREHGTRFVSLNKPVSAGRSTDDLWTLIIIIALTWMNRARSPCVLLFDKFVRHGLGLMFWVDQSSASGITCSLNQLNLSILEVSNFMCDDCTCWTWWDTVVIKETLDDAWTWSVMREKILQKVKLILNLCNMSLRSIKLCFSLELLTRLL